MTGARSRVLSQSDVRVSNSPVRIGEGRAGAAVEVRKAEVKVEHSPEGNVIRIRVECPCGQTTEIDCEYPAVA